MVNLFVQLLKDLLLGAVIHASRNVDVGDGHRGLLSLLFRVFLLFRASGVVMQVAIALRHLGRVPEYSAALAAGRANHRGRLASLGGS